MLFGRLQTLMSRKEKEAMKDTFVHSNFNYGCLIWHFSPKKSQNKAERIHERSLEFLSNDYLSSYAELLEKSTSVSVEIKRLHGIVSEIFITLNNLHPVSMKDIFHYSPDVTQKKHYIRIHTQNNTKFGNKSLGSVVYQTRHYSRAIWRSFIDFGHPN